VDDRSNAREPLGPTWRTAGIAALLTCVVAIYNRFPLTYPDTGNYLDNAIDLLHLTRPWIFFRPLTYGILLVPFANRLTIWFLPLVQGLLVATSVALALSTAEVRLSSRAFLVTFAALSLLTSLSWFSGQIMPDVLTPLVILFSFVIVWTPESAGSLRLGLVIGLLSVAVAGHLSHFPLYATLLLGNIITRMVSETATCDWRSGAMLAARGAAPLLLAGLIVMVPNYVLDGKAVLSRSSQLFALGRLVGDGAVQRYLEHACSTRNYSLCAERATLRADMDWFFWDPRGPRARSAEAMAHGDSTLLREAPLIVAGTLRQEWRAVLRRCLGDAAVQLVTFEVHPGEQAYSPSVDASVRRLGWGVEAAYAESRQVRRVMPATLISRVHYVVVCASLLLILLNLSALRDPLKRPLLGLAVAIGMGLVANAAILASFSAIHPRYQSRVVWLVPLLGVVTAMQSFGALRRAGRPPGQHQQAPGPWPRPVRCGRAPRP